MVDAIRQPPFEIDPLPPTPVTQRPRQNRPSSAQTWPLSAIPGMGMPLPRRETRRHTRRLYRNFAGNMFTSA